MLSRCSAVGGGATHTKRSAQISPEDDLEVVDGDRLTREGRAEAGDAERRVGDRVGVGGDLNEPLVGGDGEAAVGRLAEGVASRACTGGTSVASHTVGARKWQSGARVWIAHIKGGGERGEPRGGAGCAEWLPESSECTVCARLC